MKIDTKGLISFGFLILIALLGFILPMTGIFDPNFFDPNAILDPLPPSLDHIFGTDDLNRDLLLRSIYGARISLMVGFISVSISIGLGTLVGLISGYFGGWIDSVLMRFVDMMMAIPTLFLILSIQVMLTPSITNVMIVIGLTSWMGVSRLVRSEVLSIKERLFVQAAQARGFSKSRIITKYVLPHAAGPIIVAATLGVGSAILTESVLSFLGLGVQPPHASWGNMLQNSLRYMTDAPWMTIVPGALITLSVLSFNFIGDSLRRLFNPLESDA